MTDYKPGTVAVATVRGIPNVRVFRREDDWTSAGVTGSWVGHCDKDVTDVRPLVVLDLDYSPAWEFVVGVLRQPRHSWCNSIADQIEAQTKPPKPPEPTGLGAVVEDAEGRRWVRLDRDATPWVDGKSFPQRWRDIDAVRILSDGVQP